MLGPGNDNGDPGATYEQGYDALMVHLTPTLGEPLAGIVALCVENDEGDSGVFLWKYGLCSPPIVMAAISDNSRERLTVHGSAIEAAACVAEKQGLTVAG